MNAYYFDYQIIVIRIKKASKFPHLMKAHKS